MSQLIIPRRRFLGGLALGAGGLALAGCDAIVENERLVSTIKKADRLTYHAQRTLVGRQALAQEFSTADLSPTFRANGAPWATGSNCPFMLQARIVCGWNASTRSMDS